MTTYIFRTHFYGGDTAIVRIRATDYTNALNKLYFIEVYGVERAELVGTE